MRGCAMPRTTGTSPSWTSCWSPARAAASACCRRCAGARPRARSWCSPPPPAPRYARVAKPWAPTACSTRRWRPTRCWITAASWRGPRAGIERWGRREAEPHEAALFRGQSPQRLLEHFRRFPALDQVAVVHDHRRHRVDAQALEVLLRVAHLPGIAVAAQDRFGFRAVQAHRCRDVGQHLRVRGIARFAVIRLEQRHLEVALPPGIEFARPMQQPVRIEGVPDASAAFLSKLEAHVRAALRNTFAILRLLLRRGPVLLRDVLGDVLAFRAHLRIELERLEAQVDHDLALQLLDGAFQRSEADRAPGAGDVRDEVDVEGFAHALYSVNFPPTPSPAARCP